MIKRKVFNEIKIMPKDYEILNCPNCYEEHERINENHYILCGSEKRKELYLLCLTCGKIFEAKLGDANDNKPVKTFSSTKDANEYLKDYAGKGETIKIDETLDTNDLCECGHEYTFHDVLDNEACHLMECKCKKFAKQNKEVKKK